MIPSLLFGKIIETESLHDILIHLDQTLPNCKQAIVIFDLDNTLIMSSEHLGSVAWGEYLIDKLQSKGVSKKEAFLIQNIIWRAIQPHIKVQVVDPKTNEVISELRKRQISILGLTARFPEESWYTFN
jgi:hypothetical protein